LGHLRPEGLRRDRFGLADFLIGEQATLYNFVDVGTSSFAWTNQVHVRRAFVVNFATVGDDAKSFADLTWVDLLAWTVGNVQNLCSDCVTVRRTSSLHCHNQQCSSIVGLSGKWRGAVYAVTGYCR